MALVLESLRALIFLHDTYRNIVSNIALFMNSNDFEIHRQAKISDKKGCLGVIMIYTCNLFVKVIICRNILEDL